MPHEQCDRPDEPAGPRRRARCGPRLGPAAPPLKAPPSPSEAAQRRARREAPSPLAVWSARIYSDAERLNPEDKSKTRRKEEEEGSAYAYLNSSNMFPVPAVGCLGARAGDLAGAGEARRPQEVLTCVQPMLSAAAAATGRRGEPALE